MAWSERYARRLLEECRDWPGTGQGPARDWPGTGQGHTLLQGGMSLAQASILSAVAGPDRLDLGLVLLKDTVRIGLGLLKIARGHV